MDHILKSNRSQTPKNSKSKAKSGFSATRLRVGDSVVLVEPLDGVGAGQEGRVISVRDQMVTVACRSEERRQLVIARTWQLLPERVSRRLSKMGMGI